MHGPSTRARDYWTAVAVSVLVVLVMAAVDSGVYMGAVGASLALLALATALRFQQQVQTPFRFLAVMVVVLAAAGWVAAGLTVGRDESEPFLDGLVVAGIAAPAAAVVWRLIYLASHYGTPGL
jgi:hypothetical protein